MILPNKVEPIKPNYHEDDAIALLEMHYDEWSKDEDWWDGGTTWDLNIFTTDDINYKVVIYGLTEIDESYCETDTSNEVDVFELKL